MNTTITNQNILNRLAFLNNYHCLVEEIPSNPASSVTGQYWLKLTNLNNSLSTQFILSEKSKMPQAALICHMYWLNIQ